MNKHDQYELSEGNLKVLETIPKMMQDRKYRKELRKLVIDFLYNQPITPDQLNKYLGRK